MEYHYPDWPDRSLLFVEMEDGSREGAIDLLCHYLPPQRMEAVDDAIYLAKLGQAGYVTHS